MAKKRARKKAPPPSGNTQVALRLSNELTGRVAKHAERLRRKNPGLNLTRADAFRVLLTERLDQVEAEERAAQ